ncbi:MAG TPA: hypothetical protein VGH54_09750 [Mycobacterium sp.]|jgi:hypothetical protein|uniref:hypothetical protein n=1 Tax=Mycobacterium sp. TaxID=1785 RepID=UPI002F4159B1
MSILEFPLSAAAQIDYITQLHVCEKDTRFDADECVPCVDCNHAECRHVMRDLPKPIDTTGMTPAQIVEARRVEAYSLHAAITATPCEVDGCPCTRMKCGDECTFCDGEGSVEDERTGHTYTCIACRGYGVTA